MSFPSQRRPEIWAPLSEIWPDFAKSEILAKSGIWVFPFGYNDLSISFQISDGGIRNLIRNLDFRSDFNGLRQISDFRKSTPKGVGVLPATGGESHHLPLGHLLGPEFWSEINPTTAAGPAQASTAVVFHPKQPQ